MLNYSRAINMKAHTVVADYRGKVPCKCSVFSSPHQEYLDFRLPLKHAVYMPWFMITVSRLPWFSLTGETCCANAAIYDYCTATAVVFACCGSVPCKYRNRE